VTFEENSQLNAINKYAFRGCTALTSVYIPDGVTYLGASILVDCGEQATLNVVEDSYAHRYAVSKGYAVTTR